MLKLKFQQRQWGTIKATFQSMVSVLSSKFQSKGQESVSWLWGFLIPGLLTQTCHALSRGGKKSDMLKAIHFFIERDSWVVLWALTPSLTSNGAVVISHIKCEKMWMWMLILQTRKRGFNARSFSMDQMHTTLERWLLTILFPSLEDHLEKALELHMKCLAW